MDPHLSSTKQLSESRQASQVQLHLYETTVYQFENNADIKITKNRKTSLLVVKQIFRLAGFPEVIHVRR